LKLNDDTLLSLQHPCMKDIELIGYDYLLCDDEGLSKPARKKRAGWLLLMNGSIK